MSRKKKKLSSRKSSNLSDPVPNEIPETILKKDQDMSIKMDKMAVVILMIGYLIYVIWGVWSTSTWDDDCQTRYFHALDAISNPSQFISLWNRPLWILIFFLPVHISKFSIPIIMSAIAVMAAYFLYRVSTIKNYFFPFLIILLLLFQPYYLGTGRDAMTEPLAAAILAISYFALQKKRWLLFVILGSLLPLARLELSIHLIFWVIPLVQHRKFKLIPILGGGLLLWSLAAFLIKGDFFYLYNATLGNELSENRYGSQPVNTYISRLFYVIGPVVFYFLILGIIESIKSKKFGLFVEIQFIFGMFLYTLFASYIIIGQSAGFLRNLIPLSPLIALVAMKGFDYWIGAIFNGKKRQILVFSGFVAALVFIFNRYSIRMHHIITKEIGYFHLSVIGFLLLLTIIPWSALKKKIDPEKLGWMVAFLIGLSTVSFTLITEPPDVSMNSERILFDEIAATFKKSGIDESAPKVFCSQAWYHWSIGKNNNDQKYGKLILDSINQSPIGSIVIWESHYSNRIGSNVKLNYLMTNKQQFAHVATFYSEALDKNAYIFVKKDPEENELDRINWFISKTDFSAFGYLRKMEYYKNQNMIAESNQAMEDALSADPENTYSIYLKAMTYLQQSDTKNAIDMLDRIEDDMGSNLNWYIQKSTALLMVNQNQEARLTALKGLKLSPNNGSLLYFVGVSYIRENDRNLGCEYLIRAKKNNYAQANQLIEQNCKQ